jgi:hypothetical protein
MEKTKQQQKRKTPHLQCNGHQKSGATDINGCEESEEKICRRFQKRCVMMWGA